MMKMKDIQIGQNVTYSQQHSGCWVIFSKHTKDTVLIRKYGTDELKIIKINRLRKIK